MRSGDTFMIEDRDAPREHLNVIITDPNSVGEVVTACVCTRTPRLEALTVLMPGDHPFIQRESVIAYMFSQIRQQSVIEDALRRGWARPKEPMEAQMVARIRSGMLDSDFTPNGVRSLLREVLGL